MSFLVLDGVRRMFGPDVGLRAFDLATPRGEFVSLLGPSGCGKTTALRILAGFEQPDAGRILLDGRDVTMLGPERRNIGMVFQAYALFPNMTVAQNVAFGLKIAKKPAAEITQRVGEMLELVRLPHLAARYPWQLSGGQQQRVALARALAPKPQMLLLDEPLSALDAKIRVSLREEIRAVQRALGVTTLFVTHDQEEALSISDRVVVMSEGRIEQVGAPADIYNFPRTRFVASFVGTLNLLDARVEDASAGTVSVEGQRLAVARAIDGFADGAACTLALRPEAISLGGAEADGNALAATIEEVTFMGAVIRVRARAGGQPVSLDLFNNPSQRRPERGEAVTLRFGRDDLQVLEPA